MKKSKHVEAGIAQGQLMKHEERTAQQGGWDSPCLEPG